MNALVGSVKKKRRRNYIERMQSPLQTDYESGGRVYMTSHKKELGDNKWVRKRESERVTT